MADFVTWLQDVMNPHAPITIKVPEEADADNIKQQAWGIMKRWHVVTWGWQMASDMVKFRVYEADRFTARGRLEEAGFKHEKEKDPNSPFLPPPGR